MASIDCAQGENVPLLKGKVQSAVFSTKKSSTPFHLELSIFHAISLEDTISNEEPNIESNQIVNSGGSKVQGQRDWGELIKKGLVAACFRLSHIEQKQRFIYSTKR